MDIYFSVFIKNTKKKHDYKNICEWISHQKVFSNQHYIKNIGFIGHSVTEKNVAIHEDSRYIIFGDTPIDQNYNVKKDTNKNHPNYEAISEILEQKSFEKLNDFQGPFSFIAYDKTNHEIILCRDHLGWSNLCYYETDDALYLSNDIELLANCPNYSFKINEHYLKQVLQSTTFHNHTDTPFHNIKYFPPGNVGQFKAKMTLKRYWNFDHKTNFKYNNEKECLDLFEKTLIEPFKHGSNRHFSLMLSGGCDSSLLAALLTKYDIPFKAYSYYFNHFKSCNESFYIDQTVKKLNLNHDYIVVDNSLPFDDIDGRPQRFETINLNPYQLLDNYLFDAIKKDGIDSVITGHFGDDIFFGSQSLLFELLHSKNALKYIKHSEFDLASMCRSLTHLPHYKYFLKYCISKMAPNYIEKRRNKRLYQTYGNVVSEKTLSDLTASLNIPYGTRRHIFHMLTIRQVHAALSDIRKQFHLSHSFDLYFPYLTPKMMELIWQISPEMLDRTPNINRYLQRKSLERNGLEFIANRPDKTSFFPVLEAGANKNYEKLVTLYKNSQLRKEGRLDENPFDMTNTIDANKFVAIERWYQQFSDH